MTLTVSPSVTRALERPRSTVLVPAQRMPNGARPVHLDSTDVCSGEGARTVTTVADAARVAMHRTRRFTLLGEIPVIGLLVVPWLWPLHLHIVGLTAGHIRHTPDASLSYCDGSKPRRLRPASALAVATVLLWATLLWLTGELLVAASMEDAAIGLAVIIGIPPLIELAGLIEFAVLNPEWLTLKRERGRRTDGRTTYVLTSLVARADGQDFAGRLMDLTYPQWQAEDAVVIGYPASKTLISYYVRMGARRERPAGSNCRQARRRITFDCRRPLRSREI